MRKDTIRHRGVEYPIRLLEVEDDGGRATLTIATESLNAALDWEGNSDDYELDSHVYYYVEDEHINLPDEELWEHVDQSDWRLCEPELDGTTNSFGGDTGTDADFQG